MSKAQRAVYPETMFVLNEDARLLLRALSEWASVCEDEDGAEFLRFISDKFFYDSTKLKNDCPSFSKVEKFLKSTRECPADFGDYLIDEEGNKIPVDSHVKIQ